MKIAMEDFDMYRLAVAAEGSKAMPESRGRIFDCNRGPAATVAEAEGSTG